MVKSNTKKVNFLILPVILAGALGGCGGSSGSAEWVAPVIPAAASALVPPALTKACPIKNSSIESFVVKGRNLAYNGASFGSVGTYDYILAEATAKVSANDPCAATIVDLKNAADDNGNVSYKFDVVIVTPTNAAKANGTLIYEVVNRGNPNMMGVLLDTFGLNYADLYSSVKPVMSTTTSSIVTGDGAGNAFLMNQGATIVWSGWQGDRPQTLSVSKAEITSAKKWYAPGMSVPVAVDKSNKNAPITGLVQDELIPGNLTGTSSLLGINYTMAAGAEGSASLTIQLKPESTPIVIDKSMWTFTAGAGTADAGNTTANGYGYVTINRAAIRADSRYAAAMDNGNDGGSIYNFKYTATKPRVMGLGFLATRDLISFLKNNKTDVAGNFNPLSGRVTHAVAVGQSQSGRYLRDFLWQGFNTDANFKRVFDGMMAVVPGSRKTYTNYRWSKPGDFSQQHETHYTPGDQFPFTYETTNDPLTGKTDGLLKKCGEFNTCPKVFQIDSPVEFVSGRASLLVTDGMGSGIGNIVKTPDNVRLYYVPGFAHTPLAITRYAKGKPDFSVKGAVAAPGSLESSPMPASPTIRALLVNLEKWVKTGAAPLPSNYPSLADGSLAIPSTSPASLGMPDLSAIGLGFNGVYNTLSVNDESVIPSVPSNKFYVVHMPTTDALGNSKAGIKTPADSGSKCN